MKKTDNQATGGNMYDKITQRIIEKLESGVIPWRKPWEGGLPINHESRKPYSGINLLLLPQGGEWLTFLQAKAAGGHVKKGEKGTAIYKYGAYAKKDGETDEEETKRYMKACTVFHISQCENIESKLGETANPNPDASPDAAAEKTFKDYVGRENINLEILPNSDSAFYNPSMDLIRLPSREKFTGNAEYYCTAFHEAAHSTGHKSRLDRISMQAASGNGEYSKEELVAEIAASYLCNIHGLETEGSFENSAAYIQSWLKRLRNDNKLIARAASAARKATDYIMARHD